MTKRLQKDSCSNWEKCSAADYVSINAPQNLSSALPGSMVSDDVLPFPSPQIFLGLENEVDANDFHCGYLE